VVGLAFRRAEIESFERRVDLAEDVFDVNGLKMIFLTVLVEILDLRELPARPDTRLPSCGLVRRSGASAADRCPSPVE